MNVFTFATAGTYIPPERAKRIGFEHCIVYHGRAYRPSGRGFDSLRSGVKGPLIIERSGSFVPDVFSPIPGRIVISERTRGALASFKNLEYVRVHFSKLVDLPLQKGDRALEMEVKAAFDRSVDDDVESHDQILIDGRQDVPRFHGRIGPYYEVLRARLVEVSEEFTGSDLRTLQIVLDPRRLSILEETVALSVPMLEAYPLLAKGLIHICSESFYEAIAPLVDWDFYLTHWYRL